MFKKVFIASMLLVVLIMSSACTQEAKEVFIYEKDFQDISSWKSMETPGGGEGTVEKGDGVAVINAASDGWEACSLKRLHWICQKTRCCLFRSGRILTDSSGAPSLYHPIFKSKITPGDST